MAVPHRIVWSFVLAASLSSSAVAQTAEAIRARVEQLHEAPATAIAGVRLMRPDVVAHFFEARGFRPAWAVPGAAEEILEAIRASDGEGLNPADYHLAALEGVLGGRKSAPDVDVQLLLTDAVAALLDHVRYGKVKPQTLHRHWNVDPRAGAPALDVLVAQVAAAPTAATIDALKPNHFIYAGLRAALARYRGIATRGGWPLVPTGPPIKPDAAAADKRIAAIRARLVASGDRKNIWETRTMIGKTARQTPAFRADLRYIVFNPDWTVPPTILANDVLDGMRKGTNPIVKKNLTILDRQGRSVSPDQIDWKTAQAGNFPYTLRQPPGPDNALGRVKFIFPNEHSIFLHDTPHRELFSSDLRTFSSGCIRVERPLDMAATLLQGQDDWTPERIERVVAAGKSETVFLKQPLPVLIVYWTVSVGASGDVHFARDVYGRDPAVLRGLNAVRAE